MQTIVVAAKRRNGEWRGALIIDNAFQDALTGKSLSDMVTDAISPILAAEFTDGQEIAVNVTIVPMPMIAGTKPTEGARG